MTHLPEPDMATALTWWTELPAKWTPVGWKDSLFRFNVLFNGMISAVPDLNPRTARWTGQGVQLGVFPSVEPVFPGHVSCPQDNGSVVQRWLDSPAPVLLSEWATDGIIYREEVFAHSPSAASASGDEPLFAWIRLSVAATLQALPVPEQAYFNLDLNAPYITVGAMSIRYNLAIDRASAAYPRPLVAELERTTLRLVEPDGRVRLAVAGVPCASVVSPEVQQEPDYVLSIPLDVRPGACVDVLLPMAPVEREAFDSELALGFDSALAEAERFWSKTPPTAARFETPETFINATIRHNLRITEMLGERDPESGRDWLLTGSWAYADQWATPTALQCTLLLDTFGCFSIAEKYLRVYIEEQGSVQARGEGFRPHPGSFGPPKRVAACDWTSDHGAILWALAQHALVTDDPAFLERVTEPIVAGCEYIAYLRRQSDHPGVLGLMPPGVATDMPTQIQSVWADAFAYKGLHAAARLLRRLDHPRAAEFTAEVEDYRAIFTNALRSAAASMPEWTDSSGGKHRLAPLAVYGEQPFEYRNAFYLDTGPLVLVWAGLLDAHDEMMTSTLEWFRAGPPATVYRYDSDCWQVPSLHREMSSCEPVYSWNVFFSHALHDRARYLEGMYSLFAGMLSRQTYTACETRGGVTGVLGAYLPAYLARLAVIDDQAVEDELHLLRLAPIAWFREDSEAVFELMPTEFGPVNLRMSLRDGTSKLEVTFEESFHHRPRRVVIHVPPLDGLQRVVLNGREIDWRPAEPVTVA